MFFLPDIFANAVMDFVLFRAYTKDAEFASNAQLAGQHYQLFLNGVTGKGQVDMISSPNTQTSVAAPRPEVVQ